VATPDPAGQHTARTTDTIPTSVGPVELTPIHHAALLLRVGSSAVYFDPTKEGSYDGLPKATHILLTHTHADHFDPAAIDELRTASTMVVGPAAAAEKLGGVLVMGNGDTRDFGDFSLRAVPMYNLQRGPTPAQVYHPKGLGNGYLLTVGDRSFYLSGDTECTTEMRSLVSVDVAFVCMNLPYTMPPQEAAECVRAFRPKIVYPYHYRGQDPQEFKALLSREAGIEVRLRNWY
jgi:L-ascorbate metabolism protein UlaG (beta-lactamase superfamily)